MFLTVKCPLCNRKSRIDSIHQGTAVVCPRCKNPFVLVEQPATRGEPSADPSHGTGKRRPGRPSRQPSSALPSLQREFAEAHGIDLDEVHDPVVSSKDEANRLLAEWKEDMPEVPSAYHPSAKLPARGVPVLLLGAVLGGVGGVIAGLAVFALTAVLALGMIGLLDWMKNTWGRVPCVAAGLAVLLVIVGVGVSYGALGWAAAAITTIAGRIGKNRHTPAAMLFAMGSALLGLLLSSISYSWVYDWAFPSEGQPQAWIVWAAYAVEGGGAALAVVVAAFTSRNMVRDSKFCENCQAFMTGVTRPGLPLGATRAVVRALAEGQFATAASLLDSPEGNEGLPKLFRCGKCGKGYIEVRARFHYGWVTGENNEEKTEEWLAASLELEPAQVDCFQRLGRGAGDSDT